ncbi:phycobilisome rod-core linker polypeptide [Synechococcus sp. UW140]|uniref:phycobilisome rod-core linker polypeptide n=1 Tax=Synechococcus sp. UW140 TaxID=368503 RepID=UPI000E0EE58B|nr:phycobilisome rod-core linker polypeptide [Synechococcus sp. UW140]
MLSSNSIITTFGGERATEQPITYDNTKAAGASLTQAEYRSTLCTNLKLPTGPRSHEECGRKVTSDQLKDSSQNACTNAINAAYKQVFGNAHVMDYERESSLEAQLLDGRISIQDFVRGLAKSEFYTKNFYEGRDPMRTIELDFKHLLGRTPRNQAEIAHYISLQAESGHGAVIDAMVDSAEYLETFGKHTVPYMHSWRSYAGSYQSSFNRTAAMVLGFAYSDKAIGNDSKLKNSFSSTSNYAIKSPASASYKFIGTSAAWAGGRPPKFLSKVGTVLTIAGVMEIVRITLTVAYSAITS